MKDKLHKILRKWYKGYEDEAPNEYLENEILSLFLKEYEKRKPTKAKHAKNCRYYLRNHGHNCDCGAEDFNDSLLAVDEVIYKIVN